MVDGGLDEGLEERMGIEGLRGELGVELRSHEEGVIGELDDLGERAEPLRALARFAVRRDA